MMMQLAEAELEALGLQICRNVKKCEIKSNNHFTFYKNCSKISEKDGFMPSFFDRIR